ncbi:MAG TPA: hypothetical protein VHO01_04530 [Jatrophihabitans sp.]|nr:hypothetical protein [Jatrophihabitans sp.]
MTWFRRGGHAAADPAAAPAAGGSAAGVAEVGEAATPDGLRREIYQLNRFINGHAGHLPAAAVVAARAITDRLREIVDTSDDGPLDIQAVLFVEGTVRDYLPTTLRSFLAVDPAMVGSRLRSGDTPTTALLEQLRVLRASSDATLTAARAQDVDALITQGNFLLTKFSGSDLDL